jgi:cohesin loading factor subunit SCC2
LPSIIRIIVPSLLFTNHVLTGVLSKLLQEHRLNPRSAELRQSLPTMMRSLFTVGLFCRHFDFDTEHFGERRALIKDRVFQVLMYFVSHEEEEVRHKALSGIGKGQCIYIL